MDFTKLTLTEARKKLDAKEITSVELVKAHVDAITQCNPELNAFLEVFDDALAQAEAADARIAKGESQPLLGIPLAIKDNILIKGRVASAASKILATHTATYDATVITKLKAQGAVFVGRANMDEFAMGSSTENSAYGPTKNPHDITRVPGGSSGGSAASVAAHLALGALGTDTGGSIRQPASLCGVVGLKTTYGMVSRFGAIAMGSSLDQIGPFGKTVADAKIIFDAIRGHDAHDSTTLPDEPLPVKKPKVVGVPRAFLAQGTDPDVLARFEATLNALKAQGYEVRDIDMPSLSYALAVYYIIMPAEVSTNLARFDGIRYGASVRGASADEIMSKSRGAGFGKETRRRILVGTYVLSSGYADAYYRKALKVQDMIRSEYAKAFTEVDVIATPTSPVPAFKIGEKASDPLAMYAADIFTVPVNIAGVPAISVPCGTVERDGKKLPVGIQFTATHRGEETLFTVGTDVEKANAQA